MTDRCPICSGKTETAPDSPYRRCSQCRHEVRELDELQSYMINDGPHNSGHLGALERFQAKVTRSNSMEKKLLVDFGACFGKFLKSVESDFESTAGVEITPECVRFAKDNFGVSLVQDIESVPGIVSTLTFWHSLEHLPVTAIDKVGRWLAQHSGPLTRVIISVPNADSFQYAWFRSHYAYWDPENHIHQFSKKSLTTLGEKLGLVSERVVPSPLYSTFGMIQGLLNLVNPVHNYFYLRMKRGHSFSESGRITLFWDAYNVALIGLIALPAFLLASLDRLFPKRGSVLTMVFKKKTNTSQTQLSCGGDVGP